VVSPWTTRMDFKADVAAQTRCFSRPCARTSATWVGIRSCSR
jgi:hypothetical protein